MANIVVATSNSVTVHNGSRIRTARGQAWDASDPFVKAHPGLFTEDDRFVNRTEPAKPKIERATRRPGERRG